MPRLVVRILWPTSAPVAIEVHNGVVVTLKQGIKDPTVVAVPFYFASMALEARALRRRRALLGPSAGDYEPRDTRASLTMGTLSLLVPLVAPPVISRITPGRGKLGKAVLAGALGAIGVTSAADVIARRAARRRALEGGAIGPTTTERRARTVAGVGAVAAIGLGGLAVTSVWASLTTPARLHARRLVPDLGNGAVAWATAIVAWDFLYYWNHRFMHTSRYMWANHVVHHSSERYNLSTALRQPVTDPLTTSIPYGAMCLLGVRPELVTTARGVNLIWQFWIHTETIRSLGASEVVLNSPSAHRVHHGSNGRYLDRNHGGILIIWDRLFGTFEPEDEPVVYGLTRNINSFDPSVIIGHEYVDIARDVASATSWRERINYVVRGPGWAKAHRAALADGSSTDPGAGDQAPGRPLALVG